MIILILGGTRSGKSEVAEKISYDLKDCKGELYYLATMNPVDLEDNKRIEKHINQREKYKFKTIEQEKDIKVLNARLNKKDTILLDSITSLFTNEMFSKEKIKKDINKKIIGDIISLKDRVKNLIIVGDYLFEDSISYDEITENFRGEFGYLNRDLASISDVVIEVEFSNIIVHKGREVLKNEGYL